MKLPKLLGIAGKSGVGKDTLANHLNLKISKSKTFSLAYPLKKAAAALFDLDLMNFESPNLKESDENYWDTTPRAMLQWLGTQLVRDSMEDLMPGIGKGFFVELLYKRILAANHFNGIDLAIVTDVRFEAEAQFILRNGGTIIHLTRNAAPLPNGFKAHPSESFDFYELAKTELGIFHVGNDSSLEVLYENVINLLIQNNFAAHTFKGN